MTFERFLITLMKRWQVVVICFIVAGLGAYIGSKQVTPLYKSSAVVQVVFRPTQNQSTFDSLQAAAQLAQTEPSLVTSDSVLQGVVSRYPGLTVQQLKSEVTATTQTNPQLFQIDVIDPSPTQAANLANDIAATSINQQIQAAKQDDAQQQLQLQQSLDQTQKQINAVQKKISALQAKIQLELQPLPAQQEQLALLQEQLSQLQQQYNQLQTSLAELTLTQLQSENFLRLVQHAQPDSNPVQPRVLLNTGGGLLAGLLLGVLLALLLELLDTRVPTSEALSQLLGWPVLGRIWRAAHKEDVINPTGRNSNVESYRMLRTNIGFSAIDRPLRTLVITSATPREGKSTIAANLAIFMARSGKNTLLIDADLRHPTQHDPFGLPADAMGLSNAILACSMLGSAKAAAYQQLPAPTTPAGSSSTSPVARTLSLDPFVHAVGIPSLCVMPSGPLPPNPPELLDSKAIQPFFAALATCGAEVVIFDTPPVLGLSDAGILASKADSTLVVVDIARAHKRVLSQAKALLERAGAHVLGCVVNQQRRHHRDTLYSYYHVDDEQDDKGSRSKKDANAAAPRVIPGILEQPETSSQPGHEERNGRGNHSTNNVDYPAPSAAPLDAHDQTIILPQLNRRAGEQREDG